MNEHLVVLLHGLGANRSQPMGLIDAVPGLTYLAPDLRAHGANELPLEPLSIAQLADDVEELIAGRRVSLLGISLGAAVAVHLLDRVDVRTVTLVRPAWHWSPNPPNLDLYQEIGQILGTRTGDDGKRVLRATPGYRAMAEVSPKAARSMLGQFDDDRAAERRLRLTAIPRTNPLPPSPIIKKRMAVIGCALDPAHPLPLAKTLAAELGAGFHEVPPRYDASAEHRAALNAVFAKHVIGED